MPSDPVAGVQPGQHFSHPDTKRRAHELIDVSGLIKDLERIPGRQATKEEICSVHSEKYYDNIVAQSESGGGEAGDGITLFGKNGHIIAQWATGTALAVLEACLAGKVRNGYAMISPPGHHAEVDMGRGFCIFNNTAICAAQAIAKHGLKKVAIVDFDVHHGNGAQKAFYKRKDILTISSHQDRFYPIDSGFIEEVGEGEGEGFNINIPVPPGSGNKVYEYAFDNVVIPALKSYKPDLILVASGQDPNALDPLSHTIMTAEGFARLTKKLLKAADELTGGKIVFVQEGGYSPQYIPFCLHATIAEMCGGKRLADPFEGLIGHMKDWPVTPAQKELVDMAVANVKKYHS